MTLKTLRQIEQDLGIQPNVLYVYKQRYDDTFPMPTVSTGTLSLYDPLEVEAWWASRKGAA